MDQKWIYFIMSIGFLIIATAPMSPFTLINVVIGIAIIILCIAKIRMDNKRK